MELLRMRDRIIVGSEELRERRVNRARGITIMIGSTLLVFVPVAGPALATIGNLAGLGVVLSNA